MARGGRRQNAGRPKGSRNKVTEERRATLKELAMGFADEAMEALADIAKNGTSEAARVSASTAILDRAYGKPVQQLPEPPKEDGITKLLREIQMRGGSAAPIAKPEDLGFGKRELCDKDDHCVSDT